LATGGIEANLSKRIPIACIGLLVASLSLIPNGLCENLPDLTVSEHSIGLYYEEPEPSPWRGLRVPEFFVSAQVYNRGDKGALNFRVDFFHDKNYNRTQEANESIGSIIVQYLREGEGVEARTHWYGHPFEEGFFQVCVVANPIFDNPQLIGESDYQNNLACYEFEIKGDYVDYIPASNCEYRARSEMTISTGSVYPWFPMNYTCVVAVGQPINLRVGMANNGTIETDRNSTLLIYSTDAPGFQSTSYEFPPISPSSKKLPWERRRPWQPFAYHIHLAPIFRYDSETLNWSTSVPGTYHFTLVADSGNAIQESSESNNIVTVEIIVEHPPMTNILHTGPAHTDDLLFVTSETRFGFLVEDPDDVGIEYTSYRIDGGEWNSFEDTGLFAIPEEGLHIMEFKSTNKHGLVEILKKETVVVDNSPPAVRVNQREQWLFQTEIILMGDDGFGSGVGGIEYSLDGSPWKPYSTPIVVDEAGSYLVEYRAVDNLGNEQELAFKIVVVSEPTDRINWNPLAASIFAALLGILGYLYLVRGKQGAERTPALISLRPFLLISAPFILLEIVVAVSSLFIQGLSIPPLAGYGLLLDLIVLNSGLAALVFWNHRELSQPRQ
jgi:hypothetical protein